LAEHVANPQTPREDLALFGGYLQTQDPKNLSAQMVLYSAEAMDQRTKDTIKDYFIAYSSNALAAIVGLPEEFSTDISKSRTARGRRSSGGPGMYPGAEGMYPGSPGMPEMGDFSEMEDAGGYEEDEDYDMSEDYGEAGMPAQYGGPGAAGAYDDPSGGPGGAPLDSSRPSRYGPTQPEGGGRGEPEEPVEQPGPDPDFPYRMARQLWGSQLPKTILARLGQAGSLDGAGSNLALASTIPMDSMRKAIQNLLVAHWQEGPSALEAMGLIDEVVGDPALLVLVKMLPRKEPKEEKRPVRRRSSRSRYGRNQSGGEQYGGDEGYEESFPSAPGLGAPGGSQREESDKESGDPAEDWMFTSEDLVRVWCERLFAAASSGLQPAVAEGASEMPIEVQPNAEKVAEYHLDWPAAVGDKLSGISADPLRIHYVRMQQTARLSVVKGFYQRKLSNPDVHDLAEGSWMETCRQVPDTDLQRSIDVLITTTEDIGDKPTTQEFDWTVQVLAIDIKSPGPAAQAN
jgi:hypothetical protein